MRQARARGVTLVETMIVVAIVGILAVIGLVGWRKLTNASHTAEATHVIQGIRAAQDRYKAEVGRYANVSGALAYNQTVGHSALYPHCTMSPVREPGNYKVAWGAACTGTCCAGGANPTWSTINMVVDAPVFYGYTTIAGTSAAAPPTISVGGTNLAWPSTLPDQWYVVTAVGDVDGNGTFSTVVGMSFDNEIRVDMDGE